MKKILLSFLTLFLSNLVFSQSDAGDFTIAPNIGVHLSRYYTSGTDNFKSRSSIGAGVNADYFLSESWSLRSGLIYDTKGTKDDFDFTDKLSYLTIPAQANWHFGGNKNWYLNFGPTVSFLLNAEGVDPDGKTFDIKDLLKSTDFGFGFGIGHMFEISDDFKIFIDYQGIGGFVDILKDEDAIRDLQNIRTSFNIGGVFQL